MRTPLRLAPIALLLSVLQLVPCGSSAQPPASDEASSEAASSEAASDDPSSLPVDEQGGWPGVPQPPVYETWWFWTAIASVVAGVALAIFVGVTTEHPRSSRAGLVIAF